MEEVTGECFDKIPLDLHGLETRSIMKQMIKFLADLHSVKLTPNLQKLSRTHEAYFIRTFKTWLKGYRIAQTQESHKIEKVIE